MNVSAVTSPTSLPITLSEAKAHLRIESSFTDDDAYIRALIFAATAQAETITWRKLITQTWKYFLTEWPNKNYYTLPFGNLQSVTSIKYVDTDGTIYTIGASPDTTDVTAITDNLVGMVILDYAEVWPSATLRTANPIYTEFVCGYGAHTSQDITMATNASPIVVTVAGHGYSTGDDILIEGVEGNTNANGRWMVSVVDVNSFSLIGSSGNEDYTAGASVATVSNTDIDTGTETVDTFADITADGCYWDYVVKKGANLRAGRVTATWDAGTDAVAYKDSATGDTDEDGVVFGDVVSEVGSTAGVVFSVDINSDMVRLRCTVPSDDWSVSGTRKLITAASETYTSGGTSVKIDVPEPIRQAIKIMVSESYENREETVIGTQVSTIKNAITSLLMPYRIFGYV
jgi:uncharacterized phiE125 gp8 family phage protein